LAPVEGRYSGEAIFEFVVFARFEEEDRGFRDVDVGKKNAGEGRYTHYPMIPDLILQLPKPQTGQAI